MAAPIDGYNPNSVTYNVITSGHGAVEIVKQLDQLTTPQWVASLEIAVYALADSLASEWPNDSITIDCVYQGAKPVQMSYPLVQG